MALLNLAMERNINKIGIGFIFGLLLPLVVFVVVFFVSTHEISLPDYIYNMWKLGAFLKVMSLCVLPSMGLFLYYYRIKYDFAARGVILATLVYAFVMMVSKFL